MSWHGLRQAARLLAGVVVVCAFVGCNTSNNIPLVEFPQGAPPPPAEAKNVKPPQGASTSQGTPAH